jgi:hypothetical protein
MRPIVVNTKQKVAVLASGLAIATTGFVVTDSQAAGAGDPEAQSAPAALSVDLNPAADDAGRSGPPRS